MQAKASLRRPATIPAISKSTELHPSGQPALSILVIVPEGIHSAVVFPVVIPEELALSEAE
jgi:hypothetical protein